MFDSFERLNALRAALQVVALSAMVGAPESPHATVAASTGSPEPDGGRGSIMKDLAELHERSAKIACQLSPHHWLSQARGAVCRHREREVNPCTTALSRERVARLRLHRARPALNREPHQGFPGHKPTGRLDAETHEVVNFRHGPARRERPIAKANHLELRLPGRRVSEVGHKREDDCQWPVYRA